MAVRAVTKYQSEDGKLHDTIGEARSHDSFQRSRDAIVAAIKKADPGHSIGLLHISLSNNPAALAELRDALNKSLDYHRNYGKLKKKD